MQLEVGAIVDGKVTGITHFGAFIAMDGGQTGMVHISEISNSYVKEINDFLSENQQVKVKVLSIAPDGKISLSMKQCEEKPAAGAEPPKPRSFPSEGRKPRQSSPKPIGWQPKKAESTDNLSFEDMINRFKQVSNDRMSDLKRTAEQKRSRRGNPSRG